MTTEEIVITTLADWLDEWSNLTIWRSKNVPNRIILNTYYDMMASAVQGYLFISSMGKSNKSHMPENLFQTELSDPQSIHKFLEYLSNKELLKDDWQLHQPTQPPL